MVNFWLCCTSKVNWNGRSERRNLLYFFFFFFLVGGGGGGGGGGAIPQVLEASK